MKTVKTIVLALGLLFAFAQVKAQSASATTVNNMLTAYYGVKDALITGSAAATDDKAKELLTALNNVKADQFSANHKSVWIKYADKLQFDARHISESNDIVHQREHFASLSKNMFEVVKSLKVNTTTVYEQYCPMKKATWLSETATIKNPYFGNHMLSCGKTTETLAPVAQK